MRTVPPTLFDQLSFFLVNPWNFVSNVSFCSFNERKTLEDDGSRALVYCSVPTVSMTHSIMKSPPPPSLPSNASPFYPVGHTSQGQNKLNRKLLRHIMRKLLAGVSIILQTVHVRFEMPAGRTAAGARTPVKASSGVGGGGACDAVGIMLPNVTVRPWRRADVKGGEVRIGSIRKGVSIRVQFLYISAVLCIEVS